MKCSNGPKNRRDFPIQLFSLSSKYNAPEIDNRRQTVKIKVVINCLITFPSRNNRYRKIKRMIKIVNQTK